MNERNKMMKKKRQIAVMIAIIVIVIIAGTLAYWNQTHIIENPFHTPEKYGSVVIEKFKPEEGEKWQPGVEVEKTTEVQNTGTQDIIVRVKMDEKWEREEKEELQTYKELKAEPHGAVYITGQDKNDDGFTEKDNSVVTKHFFEDTNWIDGEDGWFYYKLNLEAGKTTDRWLRSVELLNDVDLGAQEIVYYATTDEEVDEKTVWEEYDPKDGMPKELNKKPVLHNKTEVQYKTMNIGEESIELLGYLGSSYTLTITTQTVQATKEAVLETFDMEDEILEKLGVKWKFADE